MPIGYDPQNFFAVAFAFGSEKSALWPNVLPRALLLAPVSVGAYLLHWKKEEWFDGDMSKIALPVSSLIVLLLSFRLNDAYNKWERASLLVLQLQQETRNAVAALCAYLPPGKEDDIMDIRRLLVLGCVLIWKQIQGESKEELFELEKVHACPRLADTMSYGQSSL